MTLLSCFNVGAKARQPSHSFPPTLFCFALPLKNICLSFALTLFYFALPLKKICLPFAPTIFMFHFSMTAIFTFLLQYAPHVQGEAHKVLQSDSTQTNDHIQKIFRQKFQYPRKPSYSTTLFLYRWRR